MFKNILVPIDKSETALHALRQAVQMARENPEVKLDIISITSVPAVKVPTSYSSDMYGSENAAINMDEIIRERDAAVSEEYTAMYAKIGPEFEDIKDRVKLTLVPGMSPADDILEYADGKDFDLIVMGCRGLGAIRGMLGSVSYAVLRYSSMPVLIVK